MARDDRSTIYPPSVGGSIDSELLSQNLEVEDIELQERGFVEQAPLTSDYEPSALTFERSDDAVGLDNESETHALISTEDRMSSNNDQVSKTSNEFASVQLLGQWIPELNPEHERAKIFRTWRSRREVVFANACILSVLVFLTNLITLAVLENKISGNILYRGDCKFSSRLSSGLHVVINILSSLLLSASNLCMQLLAAPTREEIDRAHVRHIWLELGIPSFKNIRHIGKRKVGWIVLAISSLPLHFFWNSIIYDTVPVNSYTWAVVTSGFLDGASFDVSATTALTQSRKDIEVFGYPNRGVSDRIRGKLGTPDQIAARLKTPPIASLHPNISSLQMQYLNNKDAFARLEKARCLTEYVNTFGNRSDVILVATADALNSSTLPTSNSLLAAGSYGGIALPGYYWECGTSNDFDCRRPGLWAANSSLADDWNVYGWSIDYCLSRQQDLADLCSVQYSSGIWTVICIANLLKCLCICWTTVYFYKKQRTPLQSPLTTIGDAVSSFLQKRDETTVNMCLAERKSIDELWKGKSPKIFKQEKQQWFHAAPKSKWLSAIIPAILLIALGSGLLAGGIGITSRATDAGISWTKLGFGEPSQYETVLEPGNITYGLVGLLMFANWWQVAVSVFFIQYNALLSCLLAGEEWAHYATVRKALRVSAPQGIQRSSYFISMPWRYGIPLMTATSLLHWLLSQSVFVVVVEGFFSTGFKDGRHTFSKAMFSLQAIIATLLVGLVFVATLVLLGFRRYPEATPLASSCSAAISAACHRPQEDEDAHLFPVQWGEVGERSPDGVGHCCFSTSRHVTGPQQERLYA